MRGCPQRLASHALIPRAHLVHLLRPAIQRDASRSDRASRYDVVKDTRDADFQMTNEYGVRTNTLPTADAQARQAPPCSRAHPFQHEQVVPER